MAANEKGTVKSQKSAPKNKERYQPQQVADALLMTNGVVEVAARALKCERTTVQNYIKKYPEVAAARDQAREVMLDIAESSLFQSIKAKAGWAVCFYLKTQGKGRGYVERTELTGRDGGAVEITDGLSDDERRSRVDALFNKGRARQAGQAAE